MIVLDTNVVSELMRPHPEPRVMAWLQAQPPQDLATTTITLAEIGVGLARMPESRRRFNLEKTNSRRLSIVCAKKGVA